MNIDTDVSSDFLFLYYMYSRRFDATLLTIALYRIETKSRRLCNKHHPIDANGSHGPRFTLLSKRVKKILVSLNAPKIKGPVFLIVDSIDLKVYGEGE